MRFTERFDDAWASMQYVESNNKREVREAERRHLRSEELEKRKPRDESGVLQRVKGRNQRLL